MAAILCGLASDDQTTINGQWIDFDGDGNTVDYMVTQTRTTATGRSAAFIGFLYKDMQIETTRWVYAAADSPVADTNNLAVTPPQ